MLQTALHRSNKTTRCRRDGCSRQLVAAGSTLFESLLQAQTLAKAGLIRQRGEANHTCRHPNRNVGSKIESLWFEVTFPNIECCQHCVGSPRRTTYVSQVVILDKFLARQTCKSIYLGMPSFSSSVPGAPEIPEEIAVQLPTTHDVLGKTYSGYKVVLIPWWVDSMMVFQTILRIP